MNKMKKQSKKNNIKKLVNNIVILFIIFSVFGIFTSFNMGKRQVETKELVIESEDTIWNIASNVCSKSDNENLNVQNVVIEIKEMNNLTNSQIYEGQILNIPVY